MSREFRLPDLGEGLPEAELVQWLVAEGDDVALNQTIAEVETAKAIVDLPSPYAGTVARLHAGAGDVVAVGSVLISFDAAEEVAAEEAPVAHLVGYGAASRGSTRPARRARTSAGVRASAERNADSAVLAAAPHDAVHATAGDVTADDALLERPRSTPPVRKLAKDLGVDLALVDASAASGIIARADVEAYAARVAAPAAPAESPSAPPATASAATRADRITRTPIRGVRKHTAEAMVRSAFTAPQATTFLTLDVTPTMALIASLRADRALAEHRIGLLAIVAKAVCLALPRHPSLASRWDEEAGEILTHHYVSLGIAAATERGLVVPNIKDADAMTLSELADAIAALVDRARSGRSGVADLAGGVFSITNVGVFGIDTGTPILNPGEAGILAVGAVNRRPWEYEGQVALRDVLTLSLSFDHRLVDGEQAARFLVEVAGVLREPGRAMLLR